MTASMPTKKLLAMLLVFVLFAGIVACCVQPARADVFDKLIKGSSTTGSYINDEPFSDAKDKLSLGGTVSKAKEIVQVLTGICTCIALGFFIYNITRLATNADNEKGRKSARDGILWSGITLAIFGSLTMFVAFFWNFFSNMP